MSSGEVQITIDEYDQKLDEKMQVDTTVIEFDQEDEDMFQELNEKQREEKNSSNGQRQDSKPVTKIQRVTDVIEAEIKEHRWWKENLTPKAIAIGPIHALSETKFVLNELKLMWAAKYLDGLDAKKIFEDIKRDIRTLKENFDEKCLVMDENTLARVLFVDGCAMLQFIYSFVSDDFMEHLNINAAQATLVQRDLFLLENQIPFGVLQIIMNGGQNKQQKKKEEETKDSKKPMNMETAVQRFIHLSNMLTTSRHETFLKFDDTVHLLDLLGRSLLAGSAQSCDSAQSYDSAQSDDFDESVDFFYSFLNRLPCCQKFSILIFMAPLFVILTIVALILILTVIILSFTVAIVLFVPLGFRLLRPKSPIPMYNRLSFDPLEGITRRSFRNVQEMKAAGIELKPSKNMSFKHVEFSSGLLGGCLQLCPILVDKSTAGMLLNLSAYEMCTYRCRTKKDGFRISSYLSFLDSLIDSEQDVKELRAANILRHRLSTDKEVADLFNNIILIPVADDKYGSVILKVEGFHINKCQIWMTELRQEYLRSPWTLLALTAAASALVLTAAQTYFTINPR